jgi:nucleotide-binding universal stress UspA family protein
MKAILAAVDLQQNAGLVLARAAQLSSQHQAATTVQYVIDNIGWGEPDVQDAMERHARSTLESLVGAARFDATPSIRVECGAPHRCVTQAARDLSADVILIGPGQASTLVERVFGSTADRIARTAPVPVLVVRNVNPQPYRHAAVAIDFSPLSEAALAATRRLAPVARTELVHAYEVLLQFEQAMLRVGTSSKEIERFRQARADDSRRQLLDLARQHDPEEGVVVLRGAPGVALVELSRSGQVDLIALGSQGHSAVAQALLGSVAKRLLSEAGCDVLVVGQA